MQIMFVYVTAADRDEARRIGRVLVEARLAACANVVEGMESIYWWQGSIQEARESLLILKTTEDRLEALIARAKELHSYDCPCIEAWPVTAGYGPYLDWVAQETHAGHDADIDGLLDGG